MIYFVCLPPKYDANIQENDNFYVKKGKITAHKMKFKSFKMKLKSFKNKFSKSVGNFVQIQGNETVSFETLEDTLVRRKCFVLVSSTNFPRTKIILSNLVKKQQNVLNHITSLKFLKTLEDTLVRKKCFVLASSTDFPRTKIILSNLVKKQHRIHNCKTLQTLQVRTKIKTFLLQNTK